MNENENELLTELAESYEDAAAEMGEDLENVINEAGKYGLALPSRAERKEKENDDQKHVWMGHTVTITTVATAIIVTAIVVSVAWNWNNIATGVQKAGQAMVFKPWG